MNTSCASSCIMVHIMFTHLLMNVFTVHKSSACCVFQCNNPLTKEPKLSAAQRIVPEWTDYDNEVKTLWDRIYKTHTKATTDGSAQASQSTEGGEKHGG